MDAVTAWSRAHGAGCLGLFALCVCIAGCLPSEGKLRKNPDFLVIGHRGAPNVEAENTIDSLVAAIEQGANAVEVDLCITQDLQVVVWHDRDPDDPVALARQAGLEGLLYVPIVPPSGSPLHRPVDELAATDFLASYGYSRGGSSPDPDAPIAMLDDLTSWLESERAARAIYLDIKVAPSQGARAVLIVDAVRDRLAAGRGSPATVFFMSPHRDVVTAMRDRVAGLGDPTFRVLWDFEAAGALRGAEELGLLDVSTGLTATRTESGYMDEIDSLVDARKKGRIDSVTAWTFDREMQLGLLLWRGVDGIMTNEPGRLYELWQLTL